MKGRGRAVVWMVALVAAGGCTKARSAPAPSPVERGELLVRVGGCNDCHTPQKFDEALGAPVIAGIMPVAGHKNAVFLNSEVPGVKIPKAFVDSLEGQPRDVVTGRTLAFCGELIGEARPFCAGFSLMTPMKRVDLAEALLKMVKGGA